MPPAGTTTLPRDFAEKMKGSGLFGQTTVCGILLCEAVVASHLPRAMAAQPDWIKAFIGPTMQVRRSYTAAEIECVRCCLGYSTGILPAYFSNVYESYKLGPHFKLFDAAPESEEEE